MPTILAMPSPPYDRDLMIGLIVVISAMSLLIWQPTGNRQERSRRLGRLAWMAYVGGPVAGLCLTFAVECFDPASPRNLWDHLIPFGGIASMVGLLVGTGFALAAQRVGNDLSKIVKDRVEDLL